MEQQIERYLPLDEALREAGVSRRTLRRRLADGSVRLYCDQRDRRRRLIAIKDLETITAPTPLPSRGAAARNEDLNATA